MGNCIDHHRGVSWADEGCWEFSGGDSPIPHSGEKPSEARVREEKAAVSEEKGQADSATEVKIRITKKQLRELLCRIDGNGPPIQKVLAELIGMGQSYQLRDQHWKPALQSIPEVAE